MSVLAKRAPLTVSAAEAKEYFRNKMAFTAGPVQVSEWIEEGAPICVVDVRAEEDYKKGHVPGAISLPKKHWGSLEGLRKDRNNILYCYSQTCHLAAAAALKFSRLDFPVVEMEGGFKAWSEHGLKTE